jgi:predicted outer membrane repeat protein
MTRTRSNSVAPGAGRASAGMSRRAARWGAAGAAVAAAVATGFGAAPAALANPVSTFPVGCSVNQLANAINNAPSDAILVLRSGCTYHVPGPLPVITQNLTIEGSNDTIEYSGTATTTILSVTNVQLTINQLTVADGNGAGTAPGGLRNNGGTVTITNSTFRGNDGGDGGAIGNNSGGSLAVSNSNFLGNAADFGGAILNRNAAVATVTSSTFLGNFAFTGFGGAIGLINGSVTVTGTPGNGEINFTDNEALAGGAIGDSGGTLNVSYANFSDNASPAGDGGAIATDGGSNIVANSGFSDNFADEDGGAVASSHPLSLNGDTISGNTAEDDGGGIYVLGGATTLNKTDVFNNTADGTGGGIFRNAGSVSLTNGSIVRLNHPNNCVNVTC